MKFIRGIRNAPALSTGCVATIGNFDGVHRGHQHLIEQVKQQARILQLPTMLITFEPHPQDYFAKDKIRPRLTRLREKMCSVQRLGIDFFVCLAFNNRLSQLSASDFIETVLVNKLNIKCLVIGDDFHFGKDRGGDYFLLEEAGKRYGFSVLQSQTVAYENKRISSQRVREALLNDQLDTANQLLAHPYCMIGKVIRGDQRGRALGFPTANIHLARKIAPLKGVFVVSVKINNKKESNAKGNIWNSENKTSSLYGVANLGTRPTVDGARLMLEVHLLDFSQDIYGHTIEVEFLKKIRDEKRFDSLDALKTQIAADVREAQNWIAKS